MAHGAPVCVGDRTARGAKVKKGSTAMQISEKVQDALKLSDLKSKLPKTPRVVDIRVEDYVDTDREDALRVWVILDEKVNAETVDGQNVTDLKNTIRDRIREQGVELWPYIFFAKQSELDDADEE